MPGPLDGVLVLDFSTLLPGPMASLFLAEAGAEVIKVERPGQGEEMRVYQPRWGANSVNFAMLNRGKKSFALDLKDPADKAKIMPLLEKADVVIEQFRPGVMARLGLDYETAAAINPGVVYCSITGYGQDGPKRDVAGHDLNYLGDTGMLALSMGTAETPVIPPALIADIAGGAYPAMMNILLALRDKDRTGKGAHIDVSMADNLFPFMYWAMGNGLAANMWPKNGGELVTGGTPRYRLYPTSDGEFVAAAPLEQKFWMAFTSVIGLDEDLRNDEKDPKATEAAVAALIAAKPASHWAPLFAEADCCTSIVRTVRDALDDPHFRARGLFDTRLANEAGDEIIALPVPIANPFRVSAGEVRSAPALGENNDELG
jgi:alpha-methylacyl-CoA racemase